MISCAMLSAVGPSAAVQFADVVGDEPGGLQPHAIVIKPVAKSVAINWVSRMARAYGRAESAGCELLLAVHTLQHRRVVVDLDM